MRSIGLLAALATAVGVSSLSTRYEPASLWRLEATTQFKLETTSMEILRDGEPMDRGGGGAGGGSTSERRLVLLDEVIAAKEGVPTEVKRTFEKVGGKGTASRGDRTSDFDEDSPFDGLVLKLTATEDGCEAEVLEGDAPDDAQALEGHRAGLALDRLLPDEGVDVGDEWEIDGEALQAALGLDLETALFPRPEREAAEEGDRRGGGPRGGRGGRGGMSLGRLLEGLDWTGGGKLETLEHDYDGQNVARIAIRLEGRGELEERGLGGGGGGPRRQRDYLTGLASAAPRGTTVEVEIEGELLFSIELGRPLHLELTGKVDVERDTERDMRGSVMNIRSTEEGEFTHVVTLTAGK